MFGAGRGYLLCTIAFVFFAWLVPQKSYPQWVENSKTKAWVQQTGEGLQAMLPENLDESLGKMLSKRKLSGGDVPTDDLDFGAGSSSAGRARDVSRAGVTAHSRSGPLLANDKETVQSLPERRSRIISLRRMLYDLANRVII